MFMVDALGVVLGSSLTVMLGATALYILIRWYQSGRCCYETSVVFNLYNIRQLKSMDLELAPPFTVSGSMHAHGPMSGYHYSQFQDSEV
ncbi:small integral membrane protein 35 isoform X2 [Hyla sarda]|uniref:small integral membrane protein 35 isoform X2 n=1 Tax=Hyla sarda TaxID=327740 RepID=UPI0024C2612F|nr:small integral membrane protein 35 isoform X2 [Hyla sarda]